jgi:uncharacterized protein YukE
MQSLGRARGFKVVDEYSALGDEAITSRIASRMHTLLRLIEGESPNPLVAENVRLEEQVEELEDEVRGLSKTLERANITISKHEDSAEEEEDDYEELLSLVNNALSDVYDEEFDDMESAVRALVDEYEDILEETGDDF